MKKGEIVAAGEVRGYYLLNEQRIPRSYYNRAKPQRPESGKTHTIETYP
jgi:hypothetical protein